MTTEQAQWWAGEAGDAYLARNRVDWRARVPFWRSILGRTSPNSVLEIGANAGWNLRAIREASPGTFVCGIDVNREAAALARRESYLVEVHEATELRGGEPAEFDVVFTAGLLIHVAPDRLADVMRAAIYKSRRYVLAVEYAADQEQEIEYRGEMGKLWKRPFGRLYAEMGLAPVATFEAGPGFDRCTAWLLEKP